MVVYHILNLPRGACVIGGYGDCKLMTALIVFVLVGIWSVIDVIVTSRNTPRPTSAHEHGKSAAQLKQEHEQAGEIWACVWNDER